MLKFSRETIAAIKEKAEIVEVVSSNVTLKQKGKGGNHWGLCPFHGEKTSSFSVDSEKGFYYCFGCGASGDVINFVQTIEGKNFGEAVSELAYRYNVPIEEISLEDRTQYRLEQTRKEQLLEVMAIAVQTYHRCLFSEGTAAMEYLTKTRGLREETIKTFQLGYAPTGNRLSRYLTQKGYSKDLLVEAGLVKEVDGGLVDRFQGRVIIPILDHVGRPIAFGARAMKENQQPKYINSTETPLYHKKESLYNLSLAKSWISEAKEVIVVEGYIDVMTLHQAGINNVVACEGTAFSEQNAKRLLGYKTKRITFNFDGDDAGQKAVERAIASIRDLVYGGGVDISIVDLGNGVDPDSFLRKHSADAYRTLCREAPHLFDWKLKQVTKSVGDLSRPESFNDLVNAMAGFLSLITDGNRRAFYLQRCAEYLCQGSKGLLSLHAQTLSKKISLGKFQQQRPSLPQESRSVAEIAEGIMLRTYIYYPITRWAMSGFWAMLPEYKFDSEDAGKLWLGIKQYGDYQGEESLLQDDENNKLLAFLEENEQGNPLLHNYGFEQVTDPVKAISDAIYVVHNQFLLKEKEIYMVAMKESLKQGPEAFKMAQKKLTDVISQIRKNDEARRSDASW